MSESGSSNGIFITQSSFSGTIESSCQLENLLDLGPDPFDGIDVDETVTQLFLEHMRSECTNKVGETSNKVEVPQRGIQIVTHLKVAERNSERIPQNTRKTTAWHTRV